MKRIGEISNEYNVSNRMLRYYEQKGILKSIRQENNYRYYSENEEIILQQILLLKDLGFTVKEIETVFLTTNSLQIIGILNQKKTHLQTKLTHYNRLQTIIENVVYLLTSTQTPVFESLSLSLNNPSFKLKGEKIMENEMIRIIKLPKMKVCVFKGYSQTPEDDAHVLANKFIKENNLTDFRHFGFNNPNPTKDNPVYGYEIWVTVDKDYPNQTIREVDSNLYASLTTYMPNIFERWQQLIKSVQDNTEYEHDYQKEDNTGVSPHQWLEECTDYNYFNDPKVDFTKKQLDLLLPVKRK